jgi:hypothetical protein
MRKIKYLIAFSIILAGLMAGCAKDKSPFVSVSHPPEWRDPLTDTFHGAKVLTLDTTSFCMDCHGTDFKGGRSSVSCYDCHAAYPHHASWFDITSPIRHGELIRNNLLRVDDCRVCHGNDLKGEGIKPPCTRCHTDSSVASWQSSGN